MEHIGIFGGTFDPVHLGHLCIARLAMERCGLARVAFLPSAHPPHKQGVVHAADAHRLAMLRLMLQGQANCSIDLTEMHHPNLRYTVDTMRVLRQNYGPAVLHFIIGGDSLLYIDRWYQAADLLAENRFIALSRPGADAQTLQEKCDLLRQTYGADIRLLLFAGVDASSTQVRSAAEQGGDVMQWTGPAVAEYIRTHNLYREE